METILVSVLFGFVMGYFHDRWHITQKVADFLDKLLKKCDHDHK